MMNELINSNTSLIKIKDVKKDFVIYFWCLDNNLKKDWLIKIPPKGCGFKTKYIFYLQSQTKIFDEVNISEYTMSKMEDYNFTANRFFKKIKGRIQIIKSVIEFMINHGLMPEKYTPKIQNVTNAYKHKGSQFHGFYSMTIPNSIISFMEQSIELDRFKDHLYANYYTKDKYRIAYNSKMGEAIHDVLKLLKALDKETGSGMEFDDYIDELLDKTLKALP